MEEKKEREERLIVGLGNPESEYADTRHNMGFACVRELARRLGVSMEKKRWQSLVGRSEARGVWLVMPQTYMNLSGQAVAKALKDTGLTPEQTWSCTTSSTSHSAGCASGAVVQGRGTTARCRSSLRSAPTTSYGFGSASASPRARVRLRAATTCSAASRKPKRRGCRKSSAAWRTHWSSRSRPASSVRWTATTGRARWAARRSRETLGRRHRRCPEDRRLDHSRCGGSRGGAATAPSVAHRRRVSRSGYGGPRPRRPHPGFGARPLRG